MYKFTSTLVLSVFFVLFFVIPHSSVFSTQDVELASPKNINKFDVIRTYSSITVCECVEYAYDYHYVPHVAPAGWDTSTSEYCATKYPHIEYKYIELTQAPGTNSTWATSPQCPGWWGVHYR